ncbi:hypothetical protein [Chryseobacterium sp. JAH]|uniref:hypothetical protein n=1 Tax=Chryseobacterium sp. JAH TaxID=1742858 RepID=UPI0007410582|nr:hypothetical protein [Chryseobacterium sp. JAH]KUJ50632.1 hypothetical protein AR685_12620 [Chryseobacterium sp. JAH]
MRAFAILLFLCVNLSAQNVNAEKSKRSLIEVGSFLNFNKFKAKQNAGVYAGYWYRFPADESKTHLELGTNFGYSKSLYEFNYGKNGLFYPIRSEEFIWNLGARMVKRYELRNNKIEWVSEFSLQTLFFNDGDIPKDDSQEKSDNDNTIYIDTHSASFSTLKIGQGIRFWKNNVGIGVQASYLPYRLWYKQTAPEGFNAFSAEASLIFKF